MNRNPWRALAVALLAVPLANCSDASEASAPAMRRPAPTVPDSAVTDLVQRIVALRRSTEEVGRMTPALQLEQEQLAHDVERWRARTGRDDIRVATKQRTSPCPAPAAPAARDDGRLRIARDNTQLPQCGCAPNTWDPALGEICILISYSCSSGGFRECRYRCYYVYWTALAAATTTPTTAGVYQAGARAAGADTFGPRSQDVSSRSRQPLADPR